MSGLAVVLGGGGTAAVAWEIGVLHGLAERGVDVRAAAETFIGTSAGSVVAVRLLAADGTAELFEALSRPVRSAPMGIDFAAVQASWAAAVVGATSTADARRRIGDLAKAADTMTPEARRAELARLLPVEEWPETRILVTAVDAGDGASATFDRDSGVALLDAVSASCAVPGVWPPVQIGGATYVDGAVRSATNADLATGHDRVLVLAPLVPLGGLARELSRLAPGARSVAIEADADSLAAFGANPLEPRTAPAAAAAGLRQGRDAAEQVEALLAG